MEIFSKTSKVKVGYLVLQCNYWMPLEELDLESHLKFKYPKAPMNPGGILYGYYGIRLSVTVWVGRRFIFYIKAKYTNFSCQKCYWVINKKKKIPL